MLQLRISTRFTPVYLNCIIWQTLHVKQETTSRNMIFFWIDILLLMHVPPNVEGSKLSRRNVFLVS